MARPVRIDVEGYWYHVVARGQRRDRLFLRSQDFKKYLEELQNALNFRKGVLGAFCLMPNHVHLLIRRGPFRLARIVHMVHSRYARYFNRIHRKIGHVFQGRYKAYLVLDDHYLAALVRYIHLNPVEARISRLPSTYPWSSATYYRIGKNSLPIEVVRVPGYEGAAGERGYGELVEEENGDVFPTYATFIGKPGMERKIERRIQGREKSKWRERRQTTLLSARAILLARKAGSHVSDLQTQSRVRRLSTIRTKIMSQLYAEGYPPSDIARHFRRTPAAVLRAADLNKLKK